MTEMTDNSYPGPTSRRSFLSAALAAPVLAAGSPVFQRDSFAAMVPAVLHSPAFRDIKLASPNRLLQFLLMVGDRDLTYRISFRNQPAIDNSRIGIMLDGANLSYGVDVRKLESYSLNDAFPSREVHSRALNQCNGTRISLRHPQTNTNYTLDVRAFNNGIAFRHIVPGDNRLRVPDEASTFAIPSASTVWFHDFEGHYEGIHKKKGIEEVQAGEWAAPPLTIKLPQGRGYASLTEAALINYAGMGLQADGDRGFKAVLGHALPVSHPFDLRYGKAEAARLSRPAAISGTITTPWRVIMIGATLNALVNCDIIAAVSPPPAKKFFPAGLNTEWIKPGRAVWKYLDGGENTLESMKEFSRLAGELGFEYNVVEGFWQRWTESQMRELVDYSKEQKVGVWVWKHSRSLRTPYDRRQFFALCNKVGFVGAKIDFFDHEAKEIIDLYQATLREAAEFKIMIEFHGSNKPAGESRTWPNEMTREGIRGMEYRSTQTRAAHDTTLPFTRMLAGHADYSVVHFGERRRETSWAHQIASAAILTSPVLIYGAHPKNILANPAVELIKSIPSIWDETIALPGSEIGEMAAFARRKGRKWFLAIMNGPSARTAEIPLSFLAPGPHQAMLVRDRMDDPAALSVESAKHLRADRLQIEMRAGGGFIAEFTS